MKSDWDKRAQKNALYYISTFKKEWSEEQFFRWGEEQTKFVVCDSLQNLGIDPSSQILLEIGCGIGRMTRFLSHKFKHIYAYDVSDEMVRQAKELNKHLDNVEFISNDGMGFPEIESNSIDYVFSGWTFQHMPSKEVVESNVKEISRVLSREGVCQIHVGLWTGYFKVGFLPIPRTLLRLLPRPLLNMIIGMINRDDLMNTDTFRGVSYIVREFLDLLSKYGLNADIREISYYNSFTKTMGAELWFFGTKKESSSLPYPNCLE